MLFKYCTGRCRQRLRSVPSFFLSGIAEPYIGARWDVLQLSGLLAGDVKESRNDNPTRDLQMEKHVKDLETDCRNSERNRRRRAARHGSPGMCAKSERAVYGSAPCIC